MPSVVGVPISDTLSWHLSGNKESQLEVSEETIKGKADVNSYTACYFAADMRQI